MSTEIVRTTTNIAEEIDLVVSRLPEVTGGSFLKTFAVAGAVVSMRRIFQYPEVQNVVLSLMDSPLGYQTDQRDGDGYKKTIKYTYAQISECCIAAMLEGYRITGKEFAIIGANMMPVKNGKYRRIIEYPGLTEFSPTTTTPLYEFEERISYKKERETIQTAKVQAFATWKVAGTKYSIGFGDDKLVFKIKVNAGMGDDGIVGKALSKLYTRVLMRLTGQAIPETDEYEFETMKSANPTNQESNYPPVQQIETEPEYTLSAKTEPATKTGPYGDAHPVICGNDTCDKYDSKLPDRCGQSKIHGADGRMSVKCSKIMRMSATAVLLDIRDSASGEALIGEAKAKLGIDKADTDEIKWELVKEIVWGK